MPEFHPDTLVVAVSSRALLDSDEDSQVFREEGLEAFEARQIEMEDVPLAPGPAMPMVRSLLALNKRVGEGSPPFVEVVVCSGQHPSTGLRVMASVSHHDLPITRAAFSGGAPVAEYLRAFGTGLFLTRSKVDAQAATDAGIGAATLYPLPVGWAPHADGAVRIAFDGDAVLFSKDSEAVYRREGLAGFHAHEIEHARSPMAEGPHVPFLRALNRIRKSAPGAVRIALVTARSTPAHERALRTLHAWDIGVDEAVFLGGLPKAKFLQAFGACLFLDDQDAHAGPASALVPSGLVPYLGGSLEAEPRRAA